MESLGVAQEDIFVDHGLTGTHRARPDLDKALAAVRAGDTLVVTKARPSRTIAARRQIHHRRAHAQGCCPQPGGNVHNPTDPVGRLLFNVLGLVVEFEADLIRMRIREGMAVAKARGRLRGKQPKLSSAQRRHLLTLHEAGEHTQAELAELFNVSRAAVYRELSEPPARRTGNTTHGRPCLDPPRSAEPRGPLRVRPQEPSELPPICRSASLFVEGPARLSRPVIGRQECGLGQGG